MTKQEEGTFLMLFNRNGYVLDLSTNDFDVVTTNSIGEALCAKYKLSKGKSLIEYLNNASDEVSMQTTNPTNAIGVAKELIESCCKTIVVDLGIAWSKKDDVPQLTSKTMDALNLLHQMYKKRFKVQMSLKLF